MDLTGLQTEDEPPPLNGVGDTLFSRARNLERVIGFGNIFLKFEGGNPTGTQKDRISQYHVKKALMEGYDTITVGTCGNYGVSLAYFAKLAGLKAKILIPKQYYVAPKRKVELQNMNADILTIDGKYEDAVEESSKLSRIEHVYDANPGNGNEGWRGYMSIAYEIYPQLGRSPTAVAAPVGNGTTLVGIYHGFKNLLEKNIINRIPYLVGASTPGGNPIVKSFKTGASKTEDLQPMHGVRGGAGLPEEDGVGVARGSGERGSGDFGRSSRWFICDSRAGRCVKHLTACARLWQSAVIDFTKHDSGCSHRVWMIR